jgi:hypothetical protein
VEHAAIDAQSFMPQAARFEPLIGDARLQQRHADLQGALRDLDQRRPSGAERQRVGSLAA